jgi:hypothetical protein
MKNKLWLIAVLSLFVSSKTEARFYDIGARAKGMAGAQVAVVNDASAVYWNPAALSFIKPKFSMGINASAQFYTYGDFIGKATDMFDEYVNEKYEGYDNKISYIKDVLPNKDEISPSDVGLMIGLTKDILDLFSSDFYIDITGYAGIPAAVKNYGIGAFSFYKAGAWFVPDLESTGSPSPDAVTAIERLADNPPEPSQHFFSDDVRNDLIKRIEDLGGDWALTNPSTGRRYAEDYVYRVEEALIKDGYKPGLNEKKFADAAYRVARGTKMIEDFAAPDYTLNKTKITLKTLFLTEVPISYSYRLNDKIAIGGSFKVLYGVGYQRDLRFMEEINWDDFKDEAFKFGSGKTNVGIDLSLLYSEGFLRAGFIAKNINFPSFDTNTGGRIRLYPQLRGGVGFVFFKNLLTVACDMDLYPVKSLNRDIKEMDLSLGAEVNLKWVAFRGGYRHSLTEGIELGEFGVGMGFDIYIMKIDIGFTLGNFVEVKGWNLPTDVSGELSFVMLF